MLRRLILAPLVAAALISAGCGDEPVAETAPETAVTVTETVSGTVTVNGAFAHPFTVARAGSVTAQITALSPDDTVTVGMLLGIWNGLSCQSVISNDTAKLSTAILGTATAAGALCVRIYDVGGLTAPASYDITLTHY